MRRAWAISFALAVVAPVGLAAQAPAYGATNVLVESTITVVDESRLTRIGLGGLEIAGDAGSMRAGAPVGTVRAGTTIGGLSVSAFLEVARRERAVRSESTQRVLTLSGSGAEVSSTDTYVGPYGQRASAGPSLWVEPTALEDGMVRLRVWTGTGDVRAGPWGSAWEDVAVDARTEIAVAVGTPVVIATTDRSVAATESGILSRVGTDASERTWVVVRAWPEAVR